MKAYKLINRLTDIDLSIEDSEAKSNTFNQLKFLENEITNLTI